MYPSFLAYVLGAQKNRLIETVLLSTHNTCFGWDKKTIFCYALLTKGMSLKHFLWAPTAIIFMLIKQAVIYINLGQGKYFIIYF